MSHTKLEQIWKIQRSVLGDVTSGDGDATVLELKHFGNDYPTRRDDEAALVRHGINSGILPPSASEQAELIGITPPVDEALIA